MDFIQNLQLRLNVPLQPVIFTVNWWRRTQDSQGALISRLTNGEAILVRLLLPL